MKKILLLSCVCLFMYTAQSSNVAIHTPRYSTLMKSTPGLQISFISKGAGIDLESFGKIEEYLKAHPKKPSYTVSANGKEGEKTIYVSMEALTSKERKALEKDIKSLVIKKDLVLVKKVKKVRATF